MSNSRSVFASRGRGCCESGGRPVRRALRKLAEVKPRALHAAQIASPKRPQEGGQQGGIKGALGGHSNCDFARRPGFRGALALALAFLKTSKKHRRPRFRGAFNPTEYIIYNTKGESNAVGEYTF